MSPEFTASAGLLFVLLNPFLLSVYLLDLITSLDIRTFASVLTRGALISTAVFGFFAVTGDWLFRDVFQVRFGAFLVFGGLIFLIIGLRFVFVGRQALEELRGGAPEHVADSIAMPFMIGPGTVSASTLAGVHLPVFEALLAIGSAVAATVIVVIGLKMLHDRVRARNEAVVRRYIDIVGRISALIIGMFAVEMIFRGIELIMASPA
jgi:small neutral amino acid transporter SnatA (MarC family)